MTTQRLCNLLLLEYEVQEVKALLNVVVGFREIIRAVHVLCFTLYVSFTLGIEHTDDFNSLYSVDCDIFPPRKIELNSAILLSIDNGCVTSPYALIKATVNINGTYF